MIERLKLDEWIDFDRKYPAPTFFARPAWALALADARPNLQPEALRVRVRGESFVLPTVRIKSSRLFKQREAFPLGGYTCVLDRLGNPADASVAQEVVRIAATSVDRLRVTLWPLGPAVHLAEASSQAHETAVIDCSVGFDAVVAGVRGVTRRMAGQAERRGVTCAVARDEHAVSDYYELLQEAARGWGLEQPPISRNLLEAVTKRGAGDVEIWFAEVDGDRIAGGVVFYGSRELFFWSAAMKRDSAEYRPSNALNFALLRAACERGVRWYNLGASEGLPGVERFKRDLGATTMEYHALSVRRPSLCALSRVAFTSRPVEDRAGSPRSCGYYPDRPGRAGSDDNCAVIASSGRIAA